ncbi:LXG domain-containing protein [Stappia indica]|uniref:LXG domain-containing protein n=1 Tax=Stappia indica TaxID=538381 RepID=UPI001CD7B3DD|nr:LXG domain-containing protein [Stappia indica]MCA1300716.1 LXG domain-containing protein [Stappia indica]
MHLTAEGWATARRLYEQEQLDAGAIAEMMEVTAVTVARRARADGWVRHGAVRDLIEAGDTHGVARMVARLTRAFEIQIAAVETQLRGEAATSATLKAGEASGHVERNARTLGSLAKTLDILIELRAGIKDLEPSGKDEDALRQELADRLDRLCRQGRAAGVSGRA